MRATLLILLALSGAASNTPSYPRTEAVTIPPPTGGYSVGTTTTALTDGSRREPFIRASRPRSIVVQLWYPTDRRRGRTAPYVSPAVARQIGEGVPGGYEALARARTHAFLDAPALRRHGGWPVVVFSPGYGTERQLYTGLVEDLAAQGFVVVAVDHPEDANVVTFPDGHTVVRPDVPETRATIEAALAVRVADVHFLLDQLETRPAIAPHGPPRADLDLSRIGAFGHSLGGATAADAMLTDPASSPAPTSTARSSGRRRTRASPAPSWSWPDPPGRSGRRACAASSVASAARASPSPSAAPDTSPSATSSSSSLSWWAPTPNSRAPSTSCSAAPLPDPPWPGRDAA